uniref:CHXC7 n=1 Tax=Albugo laibachii Nc14 TaxID=890382 RepID=F0WPV8_9STRA|nr:CHXC7 [Albugo laibachii Nc14]|eukprot:CCA23359.1 CHXC7 [Albugo laibachii Nc14]
MQYFKSIRIVIMLYAIFLAWSLSKYETAQANYYPTRSGIFNLTVSSNQDFSACHECLAESLGVNEMHLLESNPHFKLYWISSHSDILRAFNTHCDRIVKCIISDESLNSYSSDEASRNGHKLSKHWVKPTHPEKPIQFLGGVFHFEEVEVQADGRDHA